MKYIFAVAVAILRTWLGLNPTADKAIAALTKAAAELRAVAEREAAAILAADQQIEALKATSAQASERLVKADRIAERIEGLTS